MFLAQQWFIGYCYYRKLIGSPMLEIETTGQHISTAVQSDQN